jgi:hypothetical protein
MTGGRWKDGTEVREMESKKAYEEKLKLLQNTLGAQVEGVQALMLKADDQTRLRLGSMIEGLGVKHRELRSMVAELPLAADEDFDRHIRRIDQVLLDVLFLLNLVMADLLKIPKR